MMTLLGLYLENQMKDSFNKVFTDEHRTGVMEVMYE